MTTVSPAFVPIAITSPLSFFRPGPTAKTTAWFTSCLAASGNKMPPADFTSAFSFCTRIRSAIGKKRLKAWAMADAKTQGCRRRKLARTMLDSMLE
eukprot:CAMPEP_0117560806 /NCGR_PEP_ID=MMETSP0784-20121206/54068_1 /TAXON_ID=39447 /ORGANISM="" /LENGTH=95 /DNA_ID=CAMNT_0005358231 /DNA_START=184 /DNA_END=468 /DNA_ORIENTATION=+